MTALTLTRTYLATATTGLLTGLARAYPSVELPWKDNAPAASCVPEGLYTLMPYNSPSHGPTWYIENQTLGIGGGGENRSFCEIHAANWSRQLLGCIAIGLEGQPMYDPTTGLVEPAVEDSRPAIEQLLDDLTPLSSGHTLNITSSDGPPPG